MTRGNAIGRRPWHDAESAIVDLDGVFFFYCFCALLCGLWFGFCFCAFLRFVCWERLAGESFPPFRLQ